MQLKFSLMSKWPPLAWLARCEKSSPVIDVFHGSRVEVNDGWFCEAIWAGAYESGGFDQTDIVAGSGGRLREGRMVFVSSGSTVDRLHSLVAQEKCWVSNSFPCLLAAVGGALDPSYPRYYRDLISIVAGLDKFHRVIATTAGPVELTYFHNLVWDGASLSVQAKPEGHRALATFAQYRDFIESSMDLFAENMSAKERRSSYTMLGTLSSGYDSTTVTTLARKVGCTEVICFDRADNDEYDSGEATARILGLRTLNVRLDAWRSLTMPEIPFLASAGSGDEVRFKAAEQYLEGRVLMTGFHGDKIWGKHVPDLSENIVRVDASGLALTEYRLWVGFIHCAVPYWGVRQIRDVNAISNSPEMEPWNVPGPYSRPICRRIAEGAGVPRDLFGTRKRASSTMLHVFENFLTPGSTVDFLDWIRKHRRDWIKHGRIPPLADVAIDRWIHLVVDRCANMLKHVPVLWKLVEKFEDKPTYLRRYTFPWAVEHATKCYPQPLYEET